MGRLSVVSDKIRKADWIVVSEIVIIGFIILPILLVSLYALPVADDFSNAYSVKIKIADNHSYIKTALSCVIYYYTRVSGYYFTLFLNYFFSPFLRGGISALRAVVFAINLFFYFSLYCLVSELLGLVCKIRNRRVTFAIYILVLFAFINNYSNPEIGTWYCVMVGYVLAVAIMFWGIVFFLRAMQCGKRLYAVLALLLGFLVSGASLNVTALNCMLYLIISYLGFTIWNKKKVAVICFAAALLGGVINAVAPGNFIRHDSVSSSYSIGSSLRLSVSLCLSRFQYLLSHSLFAILLIALFVIALTFIDYTEWRKMFNPLFVLCVVLIGVTVINFPVCLGTGNSMLSERCKWVQDCGIYIGMFCMMIYLAGWLKNKYGKIEIRRDILLCISISCILFVCNLGTVRGYDSYFTVQAIKQLTNGKISEYSKYWESVLAEIESSEDKEVIVYREKMEKNQFISDPRIDSAEGNWVNSAVALYYGKDRVRLVAE